MFKVGISGTIGSGKTTVARIFESLGVPVYFADTEARKILNYEVVTQKLRTEFGEEILDYLGKIDRQKLADLVFNDNSKLAVLNGIVHPLVFHDFECWQNLHHDSPYILHEAAILLETGFGEYFNRIIIVTAPETIRLQRVCDRDKTLVSLVQQRAEKQWTETEKLKFADFTINNDGDSLLIPQVLAVHYEILKLI